MATDRHVDVDHDPRGRRAGGWRVRSASRAHRGFRSRPQRRRHVFDRVRAVGHHTGAAQQRRCHPAAHAACRRADTQAVSRSAGGDPRICVRGVSRPGCGAVHRVEPDEHDRRWLRRPEIQFVRSGHGSALARRCGAHLPCPARDLSRHASLGGSGRSAEDARSSSRWREAGRAADARGVHCLSDRRGARCRDLDDRRRGGGRVTRDLP